MSEPVKIELMIRRKGGTVVDFGKNEATKVSYHFAPVDPANPDSPHVCEVNDDAHVNRLLSITGYRLFRGERTPIASLQLSSQPDSFEPEDEYGDLVGIDPQLVDGDWLHGYSRKVLEITPTHKAKLMAKLKKSYDETLPDGSSPNDYIRALLVHAVAEQEAASNLAAGNNTETGKEEVSQDSNDQGADNSTNDQSGNDNADD